MRTGFPRATAFEYRHRFGVTTAIFWFAYGLYAVDRTSAGGALADLLAGGAGPRAAAVLRALLAAGALVACAAALLRTWGTAYLRAEVMRDPLLHDDSLITGGPFRFVRNPLYLGNILLALGLAPSASRLGGPALVVLTSLCAVRLALREEDALAQRHGAAYAAYRAAVPRLWPSLRPRVPASGGRPAWGQAVAAETPIWWCAAAMVVLTATQSLRLFLAVLTAGVVVCGAATAVRRRLRRAEHAPPGRPPSEGPRGTTGSRPT